MNYQWGTGSLRRMDGVHPHVIKIITEGLNYIDMTVQHMGGRRTEIMQKSLYDKGRSTKDGYTNKSKHQGTPLGLAIDVAPWPIDWGDIQEVDTKRFCYMAGILKHIGASLGTPIRWGGDWDGDGEMRDQKFHDLGHIELLRLK